MLKPKLKSLTAIVLSLTVLLTTVCVVAFADNTGESKTDILKGNTTGRIYQVSYNVPHNPFGSDYTPDYSIISYTDLTDNNNTWQRYGINQFSTDDPELANLTDGDSSQTVRVAYLAGGATEFVEQHRMAIVYDLGTAYDLSSLTLKQDTTSYAIHNFSVYAGNVLGDAIFKSRIGVGGGTTETLNVNFANAKGVRYLVIVVDHANSTASKKVNAYAYFADLKQLEVFGSVSQSGVQNILLNNVTGTVQEVSYISVPHNVPYTPDYKTLKYDNISDSKSEWDRYAITNTDRNDEALQTLTDGDDSQTVRVQYIKGGVDTTFIEQHRMAIAYDLGALYDLDSITIKQDSTSYSIHNYSVYAGNTLDGTIFNNRIGTGGGISSALSSELKSNVPARYVVIVIDHASGTGSTNSNAYAYIVDLKQIELYGEKAEEQGPQNILSGNLSGDLYKTSLGKVLASDTDFSTIKYDNLAYCGDEYDFDVWATDINDADSDGDKTEILYGDTLGESNAQILSALTTDNNTRIVKIQDDVGGTRPLEYRVGIAYDLGGNYNLKTFSLTQALTGYDNRKVYNFSVYAGNTLDKTIFENCIGRGGDVTKEKVTVKLNSKSSARYIIVMLDHMSHDGSVNQHSYYAYLKAIECTGEKAEDVKPQSIILNNKSGTIQEVSCDSIPHNVAYAPDYETLKYKNISDSKSEWDRYGITNTDRNDEGLQTLTDGDDGQTVRVQYIKGGVDTTFVQEHRIAIVYDLGTLYNFEGITIKQDVKNYSIHNYSVYAGNTLDSSLFNNRIGIGGGDDEIISSGLNSKDSSRYIAIVIDHASGTGSLNSNAYGYIIDLKQIELYGTKTGEIPAEEPDEPKPDDKPEPTGTDILLGNKTGTVQEVECDSIPHNVEYTPDYETLKYKKITDSKSEWNRYAITNTDRDDEGLKVLTDGDDGQTVRVQYIKGGTDTTFVQEHRIAIVYDLGALYSLNALMIKQDIKEYSIHNYSVYAGNTLDSTVFNNRIGIGGGDEEKLISELKTTASVRYVVIVIDHASGTGNSNANAFSYIIDLKQIRLYGNKTGEIPPEEEKPVNRPTFGTDVLRNNKSGALYTIMLEKPYEHFKPAGIDYSKLSYTNLTLSKRINPRYPYAAETKVGDKWVVGDETQTLSLLTNEGNTQAVRIENTEGKETPLKTRVAIIYDLGARYDLTHFVLGVDNSLYRVANYSVYAGNAIDASLFNKCVGIGGSINDTDTDLVAELQGANAVRYVLVVFDNVSNVLKDGESLVNMYGYLSVLTYVSAFGKFNSNAPSESASGYGKNILLNNTSGRIYQVKTSLKAGEVYVPDYSTLKYEKLIDNNERYKRFGTDFSEDEKNTVVYEDPSLKTVTDGNSDDGSVRIEYAAGGNDGFMEKNRIAIVYDLGGWYDLSTLVIKQDLSEGRAIHNFSVYAGAFGDSRILSSRVGTSGGTWESLVCNLNGANSARYLAIVLDHVSTANNKAVNVYAYNPRIFQIECYGNVNKNPKIPYDSRATDVVEKNDKLKVYRVQLTHELDWSDTFEKGDFDYKIEDFLLQAEMENSNVSPWFDGDLTTAAWESWGRGNTMTIENRMGLLLDLGDFYNLNEIELNANDGSRLFYDFSIYGGSVADGSVLNNLIGHGGSDDMTPNAMLKSKKPVRYVLLTINKSGADPGNLDDGEPSKSLGDKVNRTGALKGCTWADAGIYLRELSIFGSKTDDPTSTVYYTDPDSGVSVEIITYDNDVLVDKIRLTRTPVSDIHKGTISLDAMYVLGDGYKVEFLDKDGNVITDMSGRQYKVSFPIEYGDEVLYAIGSDQSLKTLNTMFDMENGALVYTSSPISTESEFILATYTEPETDKDDVGTEKTNDKGNMNIWLIVIISVVALVVIGAALFLFFFLKRRKNIK